MSSILSDGSVRINGSDPSVPSDRSAGPDRLRLAEAAVFLRVSVTTVKRYISEGRLSYVQERGPTGHKLHLIPRADLVRIRDMEPMGPSDPIRPTEPTGSTDPTGWTDPTASIRAVERERELLREERDRLIGDVQHLRAQLDVRTEELQRHAIAEEQLRVMLMRLQATNAAMTGALVQKALPPAPETVETPRRARWWTLWR